MFAKGKVRGLGRRKIFELVKEKGQDFDMNNDFFDYLFNVRRPV